MSDLPAFWRTELNRIALSAGFAANQFTITTDQGSTHGDGFMATMTAITIADQCRPNLRLICKSLPTHPARRLLFSAQRAFEREVLMYSTVLPALAAFERTHNISDTDRFSAYPQCFLAVSDDSNDQHLIILEDMRAKSFELSQKFESISAEKVHAFLRAIGQFHGLSAAFADRNSDTVVAFARQMDDIMLDMMPPEKGWEGLFHVRYDDLIEMFRDVPRERNYLRRVRNDWRLISHQCLDLGVAGEQSIFGHGDCWINNMMFVSRNIAEIKRKLNN